MSRPIWTRDVFWRLRMMPCRDAMRLATLCHPTCFRQAIQLYPLDDSRASDTRVRLNGTSGLVRIRGGSTDAHVFWQTLVECQYARSWRRAPLYVLDAGANVGFASLYYLRQYAKAHVVSVEADYENYCVASENLGPYSDRCRLVHGALWDADGEVSVSRGTFGDGREWATEVLEAQPGGSGCPVPAFSGPSVLATSGFPRFDLAKIDIEGSEARLLKSSKASSWLATVPRIAIELHGAECERLFEDFVRRYGYAVGRVGEVTFAERSA